MKVHRILFIVIQFICLSSCSITVQYSPRSKDTVSSASETLVEGLVVAPDKTIQYDSSYLDESVISIKDRLNKLESPDDLLNKTTAKVILCSTFTPPAMPDIPRVDTTKLKTIPQDNHEAVENLLIDNIRAMNDYVKRMESSLKIAVTNHRKTCVVREVVNKK